MIIDEKVISEKICEKVCDNMYKIAKQYPKIASDCPSSEIRITALTAVADSYKNGWIDALNYYDALLQETKKEA